MGLDVFDLVLEIEDEFGVNIQTLVSMDCSTVGELYQCVKAEIESLKIPVCEVQIEFDSIWERLIHLISSQLDINKEELKPETDFFKDLGFS